MNRQGGFTIAPCDIPCRDEWKRDQIRPAALAAYKQLHDTGQIVIRFPLVFFPDRMVILYYAAQPPEWIRETLRKTEHKIMAEREYQERLQIGA